MKKVIAHILAWLVLGILVFYTLNSWIPGKEYYQDNHESSFSVQKAMKHLDFITQHPHYVGADFHSDVAEYIIRELEKLGLEVSTQEGWTATDYGVVTRPVNIITQIRGNNPQAGSDLLVLAHYDSAPFASLGAADDGAGVAAILESLRALRNQGQSFENNIIICITDAEEIGLLGAQLFVDQYADIDDIGLVINFEARGSAGPSFATLETNGNNSELVKAFKKIKTPYPVANSLSYEIYQKMPNATDATIFRTKKNIPTFFMAFVDDYFNYHTALDNTEQLDLRSLAHQGSYLMAMLPGFGNMDLSQFETSKNRVFFNAPFGLFFHYDYAWIFPLLILAWLGFIVLLFRMSKTGQFSWITIGKGSILFIIALVASFLLGWGGFKIIQWAYPHYGEIIHGYPYNGSDYVKTFLFLNMALLLLIYQSALKKEQLVQLSISPVLILLIINSWIAFNFKGASFLIIPTLLFLLSLWWISLKQSHPLVLFLLSGVSGIVLLLPFINFLPIVLKLEMTTGSLLLLVVLFIYFLPFFATLSYKKWLMGGFALIGFGFLVKAHLSAPFTSERPKPNSLIYLADMDKQTASWKTYDRILDEWTHTFFENQNLLSASEQKEMAIVGLSATTSGRTFSYSKEAPFYNIPDILLTTEIIEKTEDIIQYQITLVPQRKMELIAINSAQANDFLEINVQGADLNPPGQRHAKSGKDAAEENRRVLSIYPAGADTLKIELSIQKDIQASLEILGISHDLFENEWFQLPKRNEKMIPKTFIMNDVIVSKQYIVLDSYK